MAAFFTAVCLLGVIAPFSMPHAAGADLTSVWDGSVGNWTDTIHWSTPAFPDNDATDSYIAQINSGRVTLNQNINVKKLTLAGGVLDATVANFSLSAVEGLQWTGGQITGPGTLNISSGSTISGGAAALVLNSRTLTNRGTVLFDQGLIRGGSNAVINNASGATFTVLNDASFFADVVSPAYTFNNAGIFTVRATSGIGFTTMDAKFNNTGTVNVERVGGSGQTLSIAGGGTQLGTFNLQDGTKVEFGSGTMLGLGLRTTGNGTAVVAGQVAVVGNTIQMQNLTVALGELNIGSNSVQVFGSGVQQNGTIRINGGSLQVGTPPGFLMNDGVFTGTGTLDGALETFGTIAPGNPLGTLTVTRGATFNDDAQLSIEIGGTGANQADKLTVFGTGSLAGKLSITLASGFIPSPTDSFTILTTSFGLNGFFQNAPVDGGRVFTADGLSSFGIDYTPTSVVLTGFVPEPGTLPLLAATVCAILMRRRPRIGNRG